MSKKNPFFKFDASDWLGGSIQFLGFAEKGLFIDLCAMYWKTQEPVKIDGKFKVRCRCDEGTLRNLIGTLSNLELIIESTKGITVPLMDRLMEDRQQWLKKCSDSGKKSASNKGTSSNKKEESRKKKVERRKENVDNKPKVIKKSYMEKVELTDKEYSDLLKPWGKDNKHYTIEERDYAIEVLDNYLRANGKKYSSHYAVLQGWVYKRVKEEQAKAPNSEASPFDNIF